MNVNKLGGNLFFDKEEWKISGMNLLELAGRYETPFYLYDFNWIEKRFNILKESITWQKTRIFFAVKSNFRT